jgi:hypothetical protein
MKAIADDLAMTRGIGEVGVGTDPVGDLGLDGFGEHLTGSLTEDIAEEVTTVG